MPTIEEVLQAPGAFEVPFFRDPDLEHELAVDYRHIEIWWGERRVYAGVILKRDPRRDLYVVSGAGLPWWLGVEGEGPLIELARYCAGTEKLSNPSFEYSDLYWERAEDSKWFVPWGPAAIGIGSYGALVSNDPAADDPLGSAESFDVVPGDILRAAIVAQYGGGEDPEAATTGQLRLRLTYDGYFKHPNLAVDPSFDDDGDWDESEAPSADVISDGALARTGTGVLEFGPIPKEQFLGNTSFESAMIDDTEPGDGNWSYDSTFGNVDRVTFGPHTGTYRARFLGGGAFKPEISQLLHGLKPEDELYVELFLDADDTTPPTQPLRVRFIYTDDDGLQKDELFQVEPFTGNEWRKKTARYNVPDFDPDEDFWIVIDTPFVMGSGEAWYIDDVKVRRTRGNQEVVESNNWVTLVPGRNYRLTAKFRSIDVNHGEITARAVLRRDPADDTVEEQFLSPARHRTKTNAWHTLVIEFTPESGYDACRIDFIGLDIYGGSFYIDDVKLVDTDRHSKVSELAINADDAADATTFSFNSTVITGARTVSLEVVAEDNSAGWSIDDVSLKRVCTPADAEDIVAELLEGTGLAAGSIEVAGDITFDWTVRNLSVRQALDELSSSGLVAPAREWRANPDGTVDWGQADQLYVDRSLFVLTEDDVWLLEDPDRTVSVERFADLVKVVGAERANIHGVPYVITATAAVDASGRQMYDGSDFARTRLVEDSSMDHKAFAAALAADEARKVVEEVDDDFLEVGLTDWLALGTFEVGDWVYVYHPTEGVEDVTNEMSWNGRTVWPKRLRVRSRTWRLGSGPFRCLLRRGPGDTIDVTDKVLWDLETSATVELGTRRPDFVSNPQGGSAGRQFLKYRKTVRES